MTAAELYQVVDAMVRASRGGVSPRAINVDEISAHEATTFLAMCPFVVEVRCANGVVYPTPRPQQVPRRCNACDGHGAYSSGRDGWFSTSRDVPCESCGGRGYA